MQRLGIIQSERLKKLPPDYWAAHEFCFFIHDKILELFNQFEARGLKDIVSDSLADALIKAGKEKELKNINVLQYMKQNDLTKPYKYHILSNVILNLTADMLHFLYESLKAFENRKFSVAFSLLRKPLKEHLFFLSWILADEDDFISKFEVNNYMSFGNLSKEKRLSILKKAISKLYIKEAFDEETIWNYIYSKKHKNGFEPTWQKATHLTTSHGELLKTKDYSLNFIFDDPYSDYYYKFLKEKLPYIFLYILQITLESFRRIHSVNEKTETHLYMITMGTYEALFLDGRNMKISRLLQKNLGSLLKCVHCEAPFKIKKKNAPYFYMHEHFKCESCNSTSEFPLYWLMAKANMKLKKKK